MECAIYRFFAYTSLLRMNLITLELDWGSAESLEECEK